MANDFSGDANCVALFKFDGNAEDGKGNNDLTPVNSPAYNSGDKKEGTHCLVLEEASDQYGAIADADLDAGFPGKNGTGKQSFSICGWVKPESFSAYSALVCKGAAGAWSFCIRISTSGTVRFIVGYNGGASYSYINFDTNLSTGKWYHIAAVYDAADNGMKIRIWDDAAGALLDGNKEGTASGDMSPDTAALEIGRYYSDTRYHFDGKIDEVVIFNKALGDADIDAIRAGEYGAGVTEKESAESGAGNDTVEALAIRQDKASTDSGGGVDALESLTTPQAKTSNDSGEGAEAAPLASATLESDESTTGIEAVIARLLGGAESGGALEAAQAGEEGQLKDSADEAGEGADRLVAKIERPVKGGGMKLWT